MEGMTEMEELKTIGGVAQLGSFGLLCAIAYWAMRNIPKHFEAQATERVNYQQTLVLQAAEHKATVDNITSKFVEELKYEREECDKRYQQLREDYNKGFSEIVGRLEKVNDMDREIRHSLNNLLQSRANEKAINEQQVKRQSPR